jgi:glucans biosynthesis protein
MPTPFYRTAGTAAAAAGFCALAWSVSSLPAQSQVERANVDMAYVTNLALERAKSPFHSPRAELPEVLRQDKLDYDKYRKIQFRQDRAFWAGDNLPFRAAFYFPGYIYQEPVHIDEFANDFVQRIRFVRDWFDYGGLNIQDQVPADTGYAGFKILYPLNKPGVFDEVASFLGASYFRMLGKDQSYGSSARGLALDCGGADRPEEFPIFTDFWLGKPAPGATELHFFALLDSVSCTGAYEFHLRPGETTACDINAVLFFRDQNNVLAADKQRKPVETIGWAPLTSMFWFGADSERKFDDYRPQVHDTDGLLISMSDGERLWRPLNNPPQMRHSVFAASGIRGFGLLQRDRDFSDYEDMFNTYHRAPSIWVAPKSGWGAGEVHLVELPTVYEGLDNIVAFWNPKDKPAPMQPVTYSYQLLWTKDPGVSQDRVVSTRVGPDGAATDKRQVQIDFAGPGLDAIPATAPPKAETSCSGNASIYETQVLWNAYAHTWRVVLKFEPQPGNTGPVDLRCALKNGGQSASETWVYLWSPP